MTKTVFPFLLLLSVFFLSCITEKNNSDSKTAPNILFIIVDDLRPQLGAYGDTLIQSPHIDRLASEGVLFENAFCNIPVCGASRASILTGLRPTRNRFLSYDTYTQKDAPNALTLPGYFKNKGYVTVSNGKVFHHKKDQEQDWDVLWRPSFKNQGPWDYHTPGNRELLAAGTRGLAYERADVADSVYFDGRIAAKTVTDLKRLKSKGKPFFLATGFLKPHLPFNAPEKYWNLYDGKVSQPDNNFAPINAPPISLHKNGELKNYREIPKKHPVSDSTALKLIQGYYACVSYVDAQIGKVLDVLKELDLDNNTIVVLLGDHGYNLQEHTLWNKHCNYRTSLRSVLIVKDPRKDSTGRTEALVEFVDIFPTLMELAGLPIPEQLEGRSFGKLLKRPGQNFKDFVISKYNNGLTIKTPIDSYTEWICEDAASENRMLYDHVTDIKENQNISENPEKKNRVEELSRKLKENWGEDF